MPTCDDLQSDALLRRERGDPIGTHVETCPICRQQMSRYPAIEAALARLDNDLRAPAGWQARVWDRIDTNETDRRWRWRPLLWPTPAVLAAVLLVWVFSPDPSSLALQYDVESGAHALRGGGQLQVGDTLVLTASTGEAQHVQLRIYRDDDVLLHSCADQLPCVREGTQLQARLQVPIGTLQVLVAAASRPLPPLSGPLDTDIATLTAAGAQVEWLELEAY